MQSLHTRFCLSDQNTPVSMQEGDVYKPLRGFKTPLGGLKNSAVGLAELAAHRGSNFHFLATNKRYVFQNSLRRNFEKMPPLFLAVLVR